MRRKPYVPGRTVTFRLLKRDTDLAAYLNALENPHEFIRQSIRTAIVDQNNQTLIDSIENIIRNTLNEFLSKKLNNMTLSSSSSSMIPEYRIERDSQHHEIGAALDQLVDFE